MNISIRHGDVHLIPDVLPKTAVKIKKTKSFIVAHGESGHFHTIKTKTSIEVFEDNGVRYFVVPVGDPAILDHEEHQTQEVPTGTWRQGQEIEFDPMGEEIKRVED